VAACPTGAIQVRILDEVVRENRKRAAESVLVAYRAGEKVLKEKGSVGGGHRQK
jgi:hypothetical protein